MKQHATTGLLTGLALAALAIPALAQTRPDYTFSRTPSHGKPGTVIYVEGGGCAYEGKPYDYAWVFLYRDADGNQPARAKSKYDVEDDGSFSGEVTVPADAPAGSYTLTGTCYASDMAYHLGDLPFTVDGPSPLPTPSRTPTPKITSPTTTPSPRPTPSRTPSLTPSASRTSSPRPSPSRSTSRALPSPTLPVATPSPSAVASSQPTDPQRNLPAALVLAALGLIAGNGLGLRAVLRRPSL